MKLPICWEKKGSENKHEYKRQQHFNLFKLERSKKTGNGTNNKKKRVGKSEHVLMDSTNKHFQIRTFFLSIRSHSNIDYVQQHHDGRW